MIEHSLIAGLVVFYLINLALGIYQGRNIRTAHTYVFGNRYSTGVLLLTLTGTFIGADYLTFWFGAGSHWGGSLLFLWTIVIAATGLLVTYYIFPKLRAFKDWYTLGDIVGQAYGSKYAQLAVEGISVVSSVILLSAQLVALKRVSTLLGISKDATLAPYLLIITFTLVVIAYASRAGTPGVVTTDVLQMVLILGGIAFITYKVLNLEIGHIHVQGVQDLWHHVKLQTGRNPFSYFFQEEPALLRILLSSTCCGLLLLSPAFIKRVSMARDDRQLKHSMVGFITFFSLFMFMILIIGFGLFITHGKVVGYDDVYPTLLKVIDDHSSIKMLLLLMFMAAVMSTADSVLTASAVCAVRFIESLRDDNNQQVVAPSVRNLRIANIVVGLLALVLALLFMHQPVIDFVVFARSILGGLLPCIIGISLGIKRSQKALLGSIACFTLLFIGSIIAIVNEMVDLSFLDPSITLSTFPLRRKYKPLLPFVILLSVLAYVVFEMMVHKGLKWEERELFTEKKPSMIGRGWLAVKRFLGNPVLWAEEKMDVYESRGVLLFLYCVVSFLTSQFSGMPLHPVYLKPMTMLLLWVFIICTFNLFPEEWFPKLRRYYPLYWLVSLVICLPFAFCLRWLYHPTWLNALCLLFVPFVMQFFIGRALNMTLSVVGYVIGFVVYRLTADASVVSNHAMLPLAGLLCTTLLTWLGSGYHMERRLKRASRPKLWAASWGHDFNHLFMEAQMETNLDYNPLPKEKEARLKESESRLNKLAKHMEHAIEQSKGFRQLIVRDSIRASEIETLPLTETMAYVYDTLAKVLQEITSITGKAPIKVKVFKPIFANVITNLLRNAWKAGASKVELSWNEKEPILYIKDDGPGIPKEKVATLFEQSDGRDGTGIGLPFVKEVLAKMGALIDVRLSEQGSEFMILFEQEGDSKA